MSKVHEEYGSFRINNDNDFFTHLVDCNDYGLHSHDFYEFFYIVSGSITHRLNDKKEVLHEGHLMFIKPTDKHEFFRPADCTHRDIVVSKVFFERMCDLISEETTTEILTLNNTSPFHISMEKIHYLEKILDEYNFNTLFNEKLKKTAAITVTSEIINCLLRSKLKKILANAPMWFNNLMDKFQDQQYIQGGLKMILDTVNYNSVYVGRVFKKYTNMTMTEYLNKVRLNYAVLKLRTTNFTINDIVSDLGFSSPTYFYKLFVKTYGMTPKKYRQGGGGLTKSWT